MMPEREPSFHELISEWIPWWEAAEVPYIPVQEIGRAPVGEWIAAVDGDWSPAVEAAMAAADETPDDAMVRWDHCSGDYLKYFMDQGKAIMGERERVPTHLDDVRFFDLSEVFAGRRGLDADLILWRRPWVRAIYVDSHPLEFRVFVVDGEIQGVSSYYPQRPLPEDRDIDAQRAWEMTELLLPVGPPDFTCDWMVREDGSLIIIECGPPHLADHPWADPCCFKTGEIHGIALRPVPGSDAERINRSRKKVGGVVSWLMLDQEDDDLQP